MDKVNVTFVNVTQVQNSSNYSHIYVDYTIEDHGNGLRKPHLITRLTLASIAIVLNIIVLISLHQVRNRVHRHYGLIISLAVSDMFVGGSVVLEYIRKSFIPNHHPEAVCMHIVFKSMNTIGLNINLLNLMTMALEHYVAIILPLRYPTILSKTRVMYIVIGLWACATILGLSDFLSPLVEQYNITNPRYNYCHCILHTMYQEGYTVLAVAPVCLTVIIYVYTRIYIKVKNHKIPGYQSQSETRKHTKALVTTLLNISAFVISWVPLCLFEITMIIKALTDPVSLMKNQHVLITINNHLYNLLMFHAVADPIIYTVRMREVRILNANSTKYKV